MKETKKKLPDSNLNDKIKKGCEAIPLLFELAKDSDDLQSVIIDIQNSVRNGK